MSMCGIHLFLRSSFIQLILLLVLATFSSPYSASATPFDYPTAGLSTRWKNSVTAKHSIPFTDGSTIRAILLEGTFGPKYACGFYCYGTCDKYLFGIFIVQTYSASYIVMPTAGFPQVVWAANRDFPVKINSTLELTSTGNLVLTDADGTVAWSTKTSGKSVVGMRLTEVGNLVLLDKNNATVWQSFDHPTDSLVPGQRLSIGQKLHPNVSSTNWRRFGSLSFGLTKTGLLARKETHPPRIYYSYHYDLPKYKTAYVQYLNGSLTLFVNSMPKKALIRFPSAKSAQYMRFESDGHLKVYEWIPNSAKWIQVCRLF